MISQISTPGSVDIRLWAPLHEVEQQAIDQLKNVAALPWIFHHVAAMADVHYGKGATVGSVVAMVGAVSPAAVGVDIGCGMGAIRTSLRASDLPDNLEALRAAIEEKIPVGFNSHVVPAASSHQSGDLLLEFSDLSPKVQDLRDRAALQLGTLGGGNHFIELCIGSDERVWMMLHSGSRNIGKTLAEIHIGKAKSLAHNADLPDPDLAVFLVGTPEMAAYRHDLLWAQRYAMENRRTMFSLYEDVMRGFFEDVVFSAPILCHHNYVAEERHFETDVIVTRKGAIRAGFGDIGIIPGSMGTKSYIVRGLGNTDSFESASHGAGRRMSRGAARRKFTVDDLEAQTKGVCCRKDVDVVDEIPEAYKPIEGVMANQRDLVTVLAELKQVLCVKG